RRRPCALEAAVEPVQRGDDGQRVTAVTIRTPAIDSPNRRIDPACRKNQRVGRLYQPVAKGSVHRPVSTDTAHIASEPSSPPKTYGNPSRATDRSNKATRKSSPARPTVARSRASAPRRRWTGWPRGGQDPAAPARTAITSIA